MSTDLWVQNQLGGGYPCNDDRQGRSMTDPLPRRTGEVQPLVRLLYDRLCKGYEDSQGWAFPEFCTARGCMQPEEALIITPTKGNVAFFILYQNRDGEVAGKRNFRSSSDDRPKSPDCCSGCVKIIVQQKRYGKIRYAEISGTFMRKAIHFL